MLPQLPASATERAWSRASIHDTVASIAGQAPYHRSLRESVLERFWRWIAEQMDALGSTLGRVPHGRIVAAVLVTLLAQLVIARVAYAARLRDDTSPSERMARARRAGRTNAWAEAEALAASGQFTEAAHALYRAALELLAARGEVRLHRSKTSGDYARELRHRGSTAHSTFRRFGARYDRIIYGAGTCDADGYAALLEDARPLLEPPRREQAA
jgi:hypothetical protein